MKLKLQNISKLLVLFTLLFTYNNKVNSAPPITIVTINVNTTIANLNISGNTIYNIIDGAILTISGNLAISGTFTLNIIDGTVNVGGSVDNSGSADLNVGINGFMNIGGNLSNSGSGSVVIDGTVDVAGTVENQKIDNFTGTGSISYGNLVGEISATLNVISKLYAIGNGNWENTAIWSKTPGGATCNCIPSTANSVYTENYDIDLNSISTIKDIIISANTTLNIKPNAALTLTNALELNGELIMRYDETSSSSLIDNGKNSYGANAKFKSRVLLSGGKFNYISSSYLNSSSDSIKFFRGARNPNVYNYNEAAADHWGVPNDDNGANDFLGWAAPSATMASGQGFAVYVPNNYYVEMSGSQFTTGKQTINITETLHPSLLDNTLYDGWNLIGNPYPSGLDLTAFVAANAGLGKTDGNVYVWEDKGTNGNYSTLDYIQLNLAGSISDSKGATFTGDIRANQGFFVKATQAVSTVVFENTMRTTGGQTFQKSSTKTLADTSSIQKLKFYIESTDGKLYNESLIAFAEGATDGVDYGFDGLKRKGNASIALYSKINVFDYGIQTLAPIEVEKEIEVGFDIAKNDNFTFAIKENTLGENTQIFFKDNYTGVEKELTTSNSYSFAGTKGQNSDRFTLKFVKSDVSTKVNTFENVESNYKVYATNQTLWVEDLSNSFNHSVITINDMLGRTIGSFQIEANSKNQFELPAKNQIYLINITNERNETFTQKVLSK